jgi:hypothetical protein
MAGLAYPHIDVTPKDVPYIAGTQTSVLEVVLDCLAHHMDYHVHAALTQSMSKPRC